MTSPLNDLLEPISLHTCKLFQVFRFNISNEGLFCVPQTPGRDKLSVILRIFISVTFFMKHTVFYSLYSEVYMDIFHTGEFIIHIWNIAAKRTHKSIKCPLIFSHWIS